MKEIKIDCFLEKENCQVVSPIIKFEINNPFEKEYILEIYNHNVNDCKLFLTAKNPIQNGSSPEKINLIILSEEQAVFEGSLENFFKQKINLNLVNGRTAKKYFFNFDFSNLYFKNEKIFLNFDFLLDFNCFTEQETSNILTNPAVLAASTSANPSEVGQIEPGKDLLWHSPLFYLLSSLCVIGFFVIMRIVHGKKKNKA